MELGMSFLNPIAETQRIGIAGNQEARAQELQPATLAHTLATTRMANAEASQMEQSAKAEQAVAAQLAEKMGTTAGETLSPDRPISSQLMNLAGMYTRAGAVNKAQELMKAAAAAQAHETTRLTTQARSDAATLTAQLKLGEYAARLMDGVKDEDGWQRANAAFKQETGKDSPFAKMPYDPQMVDVLKNAGTTMAQKATEKAAAARLKLQKQAEVDRERDRKARLGIAEARLGLAREKAGRDTKVAGKDVGAPEASTIKAATALVKDLTPDDDTAKQAGFDIASDAKALRKSNPGISAKESLQLALNAARERGDFADSKTPAKTIFGVKVPGTGGSVTKSYKPGGAPLTLKDGESPVAGKTYVSPKGGVFEWNGKAWVAPKAVVKPAPPEDDDEEDE